MNSTSLIESGQGGYAIKGPLTSSTVPELLPRSEVWLNSGSKQVMIDLKEVTRADSAGLAFLLYWLRLARLAEIQLNYSQIPDQFSRLIQISDLDHVLTTQGD